MTRVHLAAHTHKGKNRIREHGAIFKIVQTADRVQFDPRRGPWLFLEAPDGHTRWVHATHDHDFDVHNVT